MVINNSMVSILKLFLRDPNQEYTILEISTKAGINYRLAYEQVGKFEKDRLLEVVKKGHSKICRLNLSKHHGLYSYIENLRAEEFIQKEPKIKVLLNSLQSLHTVYYTLLVFGSYVKGTRTKNSDLDLLFIIPDKEKIELFQQEVESSLQLLSYDLDINVIHENDFKSLKNQEGINIRNQVIENHIILYGVGNYFRLLL